MMKRMGDPPFLVAGAEPEKYGRAYLTVEAAIIGGRPAGEIEQRMAARY
ncbi:hypothetical protein [Sinorhizobium meliloti]